MRIAKTNDKEISRLNKILNEIEWLAKDLNSTHFEDIDWIEYEQLSNLPTNNIELFLHELCQTISHSKHSKILTNCSVLLDNCADPNLDYLDFNPEIKAGLELLKQTSPPNTPTT